MAPMFDIFDILVPDLSGDQHLEVRQQLSAFGPSDTRFAYFEGMRFAEVVLAAKAYTNVEYWTGSAERANWTVLHAGAAANEAIANNESWAKFLRALSLTLSAQVVWRVTCESDCDQYTLEKIELYADGLSRLLDSYRESQSGPIAIQASAPSSIISPKS